jgi:carboxyl-terminal processing protease
VESFIFLKEKKDGTLKARAVLGGNVQRDYITKDEASLPTAYTEAVILTNNNHQRDALNRDAVRPSNYSEVISNTLRAFDGQKLFFVGADLTEFQEKNRPDTLYWNTKSLGRLDPAFAIFTRYEQRINERVQWIKTRLPGDFDLASAETYETDRRELEWPADAAAADALWERRLKFEILQELLNKKTLDQARVTITKRYDRLSKNLDDFAASERGAGGFGSTGAA